MSDNVTWNGWLRLSIVGGVRVAEIGTGLMGPWRGGRGRLVSVNAVDSSLQIGTASARRLDAEEREREHTFSTLTLGEEV